MGYTNEEGGEPGTAHDAATAASVNLEIHGVGTATLASKMVPGDASAGQIEMGGLVELLCDAIVAVAEARADSAGLRYEEYVPGVMESVMEFVRGFRYPNSMVEEQDRRREQMGLPPID